MDKTITMNEIVDMWDKLLFFLNVHCLLFPFIWPTMTQDILTFITIYYIKLNKKCFLNDNIYNTKDSHDSYGFVHFK